MAARSSPRWWPTPPRRRRSRSRSSRCRSSATRRGKENAERPAVDRLGAGVGDVDAADVPVAPVRGVGQARPRRCSVAGVPVTNATAAEDQDVEPDLVPGHARSRCTGVPGVRPVSASVVAVVLPDQPGAVAVLQVDLVAGDREQPAAGGRPGHGRVVSVTALTSGVPGGRRQGQRQLAAAGSTVVSEYAGRVCAVALPVRAW